MINNTFKKYSNLYYDSNYSNSIYNFKDILMLSIDQENLDFIAFLSLYLLNYDKIYTPRLRNIDND